jgi:CTP:molybdopterin cytidylyltransferase MocA
MQARHIVGLAGDMPVISQEAVIELLDQAEAA